MDIKKIETAMPTEQVEVFLLDNNIEYSDERNRLYNIEIECPDGYFYVKKIEKNVLRLLKKEN